MVHDGDEAVQRPDWPDVPDVPAIVVSALSSDKHQWAGWAAGASSYITKPYDSDHLMDVLRNLLAASRLRQDTELRPAV